MLQLQLYTVALFFSLFSTVFAGNTSTCSRRNRCRSGVSACGSTNGTTTASPTAVGVVESPSLIQSIIQQTTPTQASISPNSVTQATASSLSSTTGDTSDANIQAYLTAHNTVRAQHGAAPLTWSNELASKAQQWANGCLFQHSGGILGAFGENLAAGTGSGYDIPTAVKEWTDEVSQYNSNNPVASHFTQVVWKATTQVGCAVQTCSGIFAASFGPANYYVCEYFVQGNVIGSFSQNVQV